MILMKLRYILLFTVSSLFLFSCVSTKKFKEMQAKDQARFDSLSREYAKLQGDLKNCNDQTASLTSQKSTLQGTSGWQMPRCAGHLLLIASATRQSSHWIRQRRNDELFETPDLGG